MTSPPTALGRLHHITAIAANPGANLAFYRDVLACGSSSAR